MLIKNKEKLSDEERKKLKNHFLNKVSYNILQCLKSYNEEFIPTNFSDPNYIYNLAEDFIYLAKSCFKYTLERKQNSEISEISSVSAQKLYRYLCEVSMIEAQRAINYKDKDKIYVEAENYADKGIAINISFEMGSEKSKLYRYKGIIKRNRLFDYSNFMNSDDYKKHFGYDYEDIENYLILAIEQCGNKGDYFYKDYQLAQIELLSAYYNNRKNEIHYKKFENLQREICTDLVRKVKDEKNTTYDFAPIAKHLSGKIKYVGKPDISEEYYNLLEVYKMI